MTTMITLRRRFAVAVAGVATAAATTVTLAPAPANAADVYGAIAYSGNGSWGRSWDYPTRAAAEATAVKSCGYSRLQGAHQFHPPAAPSPPTIGHTREELDPPWPPP
ncbi:conserved secreted protein [Mycobacterium tuberculosis GM 1503]|nr:conserved secreted protein [Mycobacterium tuberculosis GM 1503]